MLFLIKGLILGISIAAPVGPIGILCIRRTLAGGMLIGFISGLGAATADAIYGSIAALGISAISAFLLDNQYSLRLIGGIFLLYLGYKTYKSIPLEVMANVRGKGIAGAYISTLCLTLMNPLTIMSFVAVFAGLGGSNMDNSFLLVLGMFLGSLSWWLILSGLVSILKQRCNRKLLKIVNHISGLIIMGFGLLGLIST